MGRATVFAIVEGYSENAYLTALLTNPLGAIGIDFHAPIIGKASSKGGMKFRSFQQICEELAEFIRDRRDPYVTTFFDYYGLPTTTRLGWDFVPGEKVKGALAGGAAIEGQFARGVTKVLNRSDHDHRFIPYLQLHELESLFYAEPVILAETLGNPNLQNSFSEIVNNCGSCEEINDSPLTAPSKRLEKLFPGYKKGRSAMAHAPRLGARMNLENVRAACPRFNDWVTKLEQLAPKTE